MTFNTGNPIGSTDPRDLSDNAENFDTALGTTAATWVDRFGVTRDSFEGRLAKGSFYRVGTFAEGYTLTNMRQTLEYNGQEYSWSGAFPHVVAPGTDPTVVAGYVPRTDVLLRGELLTGALDMRNGLFALRDLISASDFGAIGDGHADDTLALQEFFNECSKGNRGYIPAGVYNHGLLTIASAPAGINVFGASSGQYNNDSGTVLNCTATNGAGLVVNGTSSPANSLFSNIVFKGNSNLSACVKITAASNFRFEHCVFKGSSGTNASGVLLTREDGQFTGVCSFTECVFHGNSNGVWCNKVDTNVVNFTRSQFFGNSRGFANGDSTIASSMRSVNFTDCYFEDNNFGDICSYGGALSFNVTGCYFEWGQTRTPILFLTSGFSPINNAINITGNLFSGTPGDGQGFVSLGETDGFTFRNNTAHVSAPNSFGVVASPVITHFWVDEMSVPSGIVKPKSLKLGGNQYDRQYTDFAPSGTWIPASAGGYITFSSASGTYTRVGNIVVAQFSVTFPANTNGNQAGISGLPFPVSASQVAGGAVNNSTYTGDKVEIAIVPSSYYFNFQKQDGSVITNLKLASSTIKGTVTYMAKDS